MARAKISTNTHGPAIRGVDPWAPSAGKMRQLLSEEERARLAVLASIVRFNKGEEIYRKGQRADAVFNIIELGEQNLPELTAFQVPSLHHPK